MARRWVVGVVAVLATAPLVLGGCSTAPQASKSLPSASPSSASNSLAPLGPADFPVPAEARQKTSDGASDFVLYYIELYNRAKRQLDSQYLEAFSLNCSSCDELARQLREVAQAGQAYSGGDVVVNAAPSGALKGEQAEVAFSATERPLTILQRGVPVAGQSYRERNSPSSGAVLSWDEQRGTWLITQLDIG